MNQGWRWMGVWDWGLTVLVLYAQVQQQCCNLGDFWLLKQQVLQSPGSHAQPVPTMQRAQQPRFALVASLPDQFVVSICGGCKKGLLILDVVNGMHNLDATAGGKQASDVASTLRSSKMFEGIEIVSDLAGHKRFIKGFKSAASL